MLQRNVIFRSFRNTFVTCCLRFTPPSLVTMQNSLPVADLPYRVRLLIRTGIAKRCFIISIRLLLNPHLMDLHGATPLKTPLQSPKLQQWRNSLLTSQNSTLLLPHFLRSEGFGMLRGGAFFEEFPVCNVFLAEFSTDGLMERFHFGIEITHPR